jgi:hypothetical protein
MRPLAGVRPLALAALTILVGLASRRIPGLPTEVGDVLYAVMAFWLARVALDARRAWLVATVFCLCVEVGQLYHAPWLDGLRATRASQ